MKTKIIILFLILNSFTPLGQFVILHSQLVHEEWVARYNGPINDLYGPFLAGDKDGNSYVAGTHVLNDSINILCVKYNSSGVQQWATLYKYPGYGWFAPMGLTLDTSGNPCVISDFGPSVLNDYRTLTIKFNYLNGNVLWAKTYFGNYLGCEPWDIKVDKQNNIYVVGWVDSSSLCIKYNSNGDSLWVRTWHPPAGDDAGANACTIDDSLNVILTGYRYHHVMSSGVDTMLTIKYSQNGDLRWISTFYNQPAGNFRLNDGLYIISDQYGNIYVGGETDDNMGYYEYVTLKYNNNGVQQWVSIFNGGYPDSFIRGITIDKIHNFVFVTGWSSASNLKYDFLTVKYDVSNGDSIWVIRYNGTANDNDEAFDIKIDTLGSVYVTGGSVNTGTGSDVVTIKYSQQGNQVWVATYNGPANGGDAGRSIFLDYLNNVYIGGVSQGDYVVIKYSQLTGIQIIKKEIPEMFMLYQNYPNPFNSQTSINFSIPYKSMVNIIIYDILGRQIKLLVNQELNPGSYKYIWDASGYASGIYFLKFYAVSNQKSQNYSDIKKIILNK